MALGAAGACGGGLLLLFAAGLDVARLTRDPAAGGPLGAGAVSLLGSLAWAVGAASLGFAGALTVAQDGRSSPTARLLLASAAFTAILCLDDTLVLHERTRTFGDAGALLVLAFYLLAGVAWLIVARALADRRHRPVLLLAVGLLAASLAVDTIVDLLDASSAALPLAVEDALKAGGIAAWTVLAVSVAWTHTGGRVGADLPRSKRERAFAPGALGRHGVERVEPGSGDAPMADQPTPSNVEKDPEEWVTGEEPMTGAQSSYLKTLSDEAGEPFDESLSKADASKRIDELQSKTGRGS